MMDLPWWGYVLYTLALTHITIAAVTIYLHRHQAHRALDLHPVVSHFFRFWLWLTTGMVTREWTAIHRKHHARCETPEDPHSPQIVGIRKVLLQGTELYRQEAKNRETLERYGYGTPDDWVERNVYSRFSSWGVVLMLAIDVALFGPIGITIWAVQMLWIPVLAAGVINGLGHYWGYRNYQTEDASTNIFPWGILIGGEELHNNHHAYASSAKLSARWYEFDIGWVYIRILSALGLAQVKRIAPRLKLDPSKPVPDAATLQAVITHRYEVLARYAKAVKRAWRHEVAWLKERLPRDGIRVDPAAVKRWLLRDQEELGTHEREKLHLVLRYSRALETLYCMRQELTALWRRSSLSREQLVKQLQDWCQRAEQSGIAQLEEFSRRLRCYA
ncbi:DesA family fatty acid desaturase [Pelomicrobium sp.]|jgi:stearoyl-CoA desaturase (delta-9 desaturase)|uniref:DesA family fatty acid desaturase n=1 Tax=Pelomicrobium sp. TaxID=2815319 RepID=UPI002FDD753C